MNSEGVASQFTYLERAGDGFQRTAWLTESEIVFVVGGIPTGTPVDLIISHTNDSKWKVREPSGRVSPNEFSRLTYLGTNGTVYKASVNCEGSLGEPPKIYTHFTETSEDGKQKKNKIKSIEIVDWDNSHWRVEIRDVQVHIKNSKGQPDFYLTKIR